MSVESIGFKKLLDDAYKLYSKTKITIEEYCDCIEMIGDAKKEGKNLKEVSAILFLTCLSFLNIL